MIFCYIILFIFVGLILKLLPLETMEKVGVCFFAFILMFSIFVSSEIVKEKGRVIALKEVGYRECTKEELYVMSDMEKDKLPKTYDFSKGTIYWKLGENK